MHAKEWEYGRKRYIKISQKKKNKKVSRVRKGKMQKQKKQNKQTNKNKKKMQEKKRQICYKYQMEAWGWSNLYGENLVGLVSSLMTTQVFYFMFFMRFIK